MKKKEKRIQIFLILIGFLLILITYFYYPYMKSSKFIADKIDEGNLKNKTADNLDSTFQNVSYKGFYDLDKTFTVNAEDAFILNEEPNAVYMKNMHVTLYLSESRIVIITSDRGKYNKITYDCFFEQNVKATDDDTVIFAENLDLLATGNSVDVHNDVYLKHATGSLHADKINYNFETKYFKVSMFDDKAIKMKVIK